MQHNEEYDITAAFKKIEDELIASMIRNMDRHRAEEDDEGILWTQWQTEQLKSLEMYKLQNQKKYNKQFKMLNKRVEGLLKIAYDTGNMEQEIEILEAIKNGFKGYKKASDTLQAEFFRLNERKLEALIKATTDDMKKAETAVLRMANDKYRKAIFDAQVYANTGAGTYEKAVDMATKDMLAAGLNCIEYANGARHTLSDYADMAIRTASKRAYLQGEGQKRQEWGITTVIINKRGNPCPKCLPFVGKVLIDDVWSGGKAEDGNYPLMSYAVSRGLYHPRCKDSHTTYFLGISTADDTWTKEELEAVGLKAKQEARQQYAQRQKEKYERLSKHSLDDENKRRYADRREEWKKEASESVRDSAQKMKIEFPDHVFKVKGFTKDVKKEVDNAMKKLETEYDIRLNSIVVEPAGKGDIFVTGYHDGVVDMVVNENIDFDRIINSIQRKYNEGYLAGKSLEDYIAHEMAHCMLYQDCTSDIQYKAKYKQIEGLYESLKGISGYADKTKSGNEALAEAFVRVRNKEEVPPIAKVLVESYFGRFKK